MIIIFRTSGAIIYDFQTLEDCTHHFSKQKRSYIVWYIGIIHTFLKYGYMRYKFISQVLRGCKRYEFLIRHCVPNFF